MLNISSKNIDLLLRNIGLEEVNSGWFTIKSKEYVHAKWPILNTSLQIIKICGPVNFLSLCDGIERSIKRYFRTIAPPLVVQRHLEVTGFEFLDGIPSISKELQDQEVEISDSEKLFLSLYESSGPVLHFNEIVEAFEEAGYSASTATSKVLPQSPIVEKVDIACYTLRGKKVTPEEINRAITRQNEDEQIISGRISFLSKRRNKTISLSTETEEDKVLPEPIETSDKKTAQKATEEFPHYFRKLIFSFF